MQPTKIADGVYDVGVIDWNIRDFHGYSTDRGTSYNAYLVIDDKVALIDTVKAPFADQLIGNISQIIDPKKIDVVVSNHTEMDHSGALPRIMPAISPTPGTITRSTTAKRSVWAIAPSRSWKPA